MQDQQLELIDIYHVWHVPFWQRGWFWVAVAVCVSIIILGGGWLLYRWYNSRQTLAPWQQAVNELVALTQLAADAHNGERFYVRLTACMKRFLSAHCQHDLMGYTDQQVLEYSQDQPFSAEHKTALERIFLGGQMIKFAQGESAVDQMRRDCAQAQQVVQELHQQQVMQART